jgi:hypothetical protein
LSQTGRISSLKNGVLSQKRRFLSQYGGKNNFIHSITGNARFFARQNKDKQKQHV